MKAKRQQTRVFCIGLSKTGTTSLTAALKMLGYHAKHFPIRMIRYSDGRLSFDRSIAARYDALSDLPIARFYRELDEAFPGSRFILTTRQIDDWLDSCRRHVWPGQLIKADTWFNRLHRDMYGAIDYDRQRFREAYIRHVDNVNTYFEGREDDLLEFNVASGDSWKKLCTFLDKPVPDEPFPKKDCLYSTFFKLVPLHRLRNRR
jgi:hypothetical protein